jgi:ribosomal protein S18 acetylase RimI-like enzyme
MALSPIFRLATLRDAADLAILIDIAGNGLPNHIWLDKAGPGHSALEVGRQLVRGDDSEDSFRNATIAMMGTQIAGCIIGGLPEHLYDLSRVDEKPAIFRPVARLAVQVAGTWYVDVIANFPEFRGQGLGRQMLEYVATKAHNVGAPATTLIVGSWNDGAAGLYAQCGYRPTAREPVTLPKSFPCSGEWVLMTRPLT